MPRPSGTWITPRRTISCGARRVISSPSSQMLPAAARSSPEIARRALVLPAPFAPISVTICPASTRREMPCSASMAP